jgi:hypothetical protein
VDLPIDLFLGVPTSENSIPNLSILDKAGEYDEAFPRNFYEAT